MLGLATGGVEHLSAQSNDRFLAKDDILLLGLGLKVEPAQQTVPKDIATIVSTMFVAPQTPGNLPPFSPDAVVKGTLRGPSFPTPVELTVKPNTPFNIPPLSVAGKHTLDNIRLVSNGEVILRGTPESVVIDVIDRLLITEVTARPLTAAEIIAKNLVFDKSSYQAYNFSAAFAIEDKKVPISFTVVLPTLQSAEDAANSKVILPGIGSQPGLPSLQTVIPDSLKRLQTQIPNLNVQGFTLQVPQVAGQNFFVPPIPGVVVIPGDIGFLDQFFSVMLMVGNVAPAGSNLVVTNLKAEIVLPRGIDTGSSVDPLRMGQTPYGESPRVQPVAQPGPDGRLGTADDVNSLGPGDTGNAEFLVEGRREGSHIIDIDITGTLLGLPIGPVAVHGRARGAVLVRNPTFTLTFTHPEVVTAGEAYTLDVTVTNTGSSPANFVSLNLFPGVVSGAQIVGDPTRQIETIAAGDSASVSFDLIAKVSGKVFAATLDSDDNVKGRFALKTSVGELGIPLSPDTLVLPKEAGSLPADLRTAAIGLLGKAYALATAPAAALPKDAKRLSKKLVWDRAIEVASAGLRVSLHEPVRASASQLLMDFAGSNFARLPNRYTNPDDLDFARTDFLGFDDLRRRSTRGDVFAQAVAALMQADLASAGAAAFHHDFATKISYRPGHISVLISAAGPLPVTLTLVDSAGRRLGGIAGVKVIKEIPFSEYLQFGPLGEPTGQMALIASPESGDFKIRLDPVSGMVGLPYTLSVVVPDAQGKLQQYVFDNVNPNTLPILPVAPSDPYRVTVETGGAIATASVTTPVTDPAPSIIGIVQQGQADQVCVDPGKSAGLWAPGRVVAVLFSEEVTAQSVQDKFKPENISHYVLAGNAVVGVALQPDGRVAFLALRDPIGPFVPRSLTIQGVADLHGQAMPAQTSPIEITVSDFAGVVSGRVLHADGSPVPFADVRLFYACPAADDELRWVGISSKTADADGKYSWDYVLRAPRLLAVDPETNEFRDLQFSVARNGQQLNIDVVMLGRGTLQGRTLSETGQPLKDSAIKVTSLTDSSQYSATTDADGRFTVSRIPVGNIFIEAVNVTANAKMSISENIPFAGATTSRDFVLLKADSPKAIEVKRGTVTGHVLRSTGTGSLAGLPVVVYYTGGSQEGVGCPVFFAECAIALGSTNADGAFSIAGVPAGRLRVTSFDQATLQEGEASLQLAPDTTAAVNVVISGGLGAVRGVVLDASGNGVANARVGGGLSLVTTDATGHFLLPDVPLGRRTLVAVNDVDGTSGRADVDLTRPGEEVSATIVLEAVGTIAGTIYRVDGVTPVPGITAYLYKLPIQNGRVEIIAQATADSNGHYQMTTIPAGKYRLTAFQPDFGDGNLANVAVRFNNETVKADVVFRGGRGTVTGTVVDASGTPVKARVSLSGDQPVIAGGLVVVDFQYVQNFQIVDSNITTGKFSMSGLWPGAFTLRAAGPFSPDPIALEATMPAPASTMDVVVKIQPTSQVTGKVLRPDGTPVGAGVIVKYKSDEFKTFCAELSSGDTSCTTVPQGVQEAIAVTDDTGTFLFAVVNAGNYTLTAFEDVALSGRTTRIRGSVRAGETATVTIKLPAVADLIVKVYASDAQTLIPGAKVQVSQIDYPNRTVTLFAGQTGDDLGIARFTGGDAFSQGPFVVTATGTQNGFAGVASGKIVNDGEAVTINVYLASATGSVHGVVRRPDGSPASNASVVISNADGPIGFNVTDGEGNYAQDLIPLGPFKVDAFEAANAGHGAATGQIFTAGQNVPADITEDAPAVVTGRVVDAASLTPLKGWTVTLNQTTSSGRSMALTTTSGVDGSFSFPGAAVGSFVVRASKDNVQGFATAQGQITQAGQLVDMPLTVNVIRPSFGSVQGTVFHANGSPAGNVKVCVSSCEPGSLSVTAAADGTFTIDHLALGRQLIVATPQTGVETGSVFASIEFDGDVAKVQVVLAGISQLTGVVLANGVPVAGARVSLLGIPQVSREGFADGNGRFSFTDVSARSFTITAFAPPSFTTRGVISDRLNAGETKDLVVVLEPTGALKGRAVLESNGSGAAGVTAEAVINSKHFFTESGPDGSFVFDTLPLGNYTLRLQDPLGTGIASKVGTLAGVSDVGDVTLDAASPVVVQMQPTPSATGVAKSATIQVVMSEAIDPATVNLANVSLVAPSGSIAGSVEQSDGDKTLTFKPVTALSEQTKYTVRVKSLQDRVGHVMHGEFVGSFTTADTIAPAVVDKSPAPGTNGVSIYSPIRIVYSEPIDPAKFRGPPTLTLSTSAGPVAGRLDFIIGNTVAVFTPNLPLAQGASYRVQSPAAVDLAGNAQAAGLDYTFTTSTGAPPTITELTPAAASVIENTVTSVTATIGAFDVAYVDFFLNDVFAATLPAPFKFSFQAVPLLGKPGDKIKVSALATDTSGVHGVDRISTFVTILLDQPPTATIQIPAASLIAGNGEHVDVTVQATDDVGIEKVSFKAQTGKPLDAATRSVSPAAKIRSEAFGFVVPTDATPGSTIAVQASVVDTKGQQIDAAPVTVAVRDSVAPTVKITGATSGTQVRAGQQTTVIVTVQDAGSVHSVTFKATGAAALTQTRIIDPAQPSIVTSFTVQVPAGAKPPQSLILDATAEDRAGNVGAAARVILPVADNVAPTVTSLHTDTGKLEIGRGRAVTIVVNAEDDLGVSEIDLQGSGAFTLSTARAITPPIGTASTSFAVQVPADAAPGSVLTVQATAVDLAGNSSVPMTLALTVTALPDVTFGSSLTMDAGDTKQMLVQLASPAPAGGTRIDFTTDPSVATSTSFVVVPAGQTNGAVTVTGVAGGTTFINAFIDGVQRASATVTVQGGIVSGTVLDPQLAPAAGAIVAVTSAFTTLTTETDAQGHFRVVGLPGSSVSVKVQKDVDQTTRLLGFATGSMNRTNGFLHVDIVVLAAGFLHGPVYLADGVTPVADGAKVELFEAANAQDPISTTFTANGTYEFPLVAVGKYNVAVSDTSGNRGIAPAEITSSGQDVTTPVSFLGRGSVTVTVKDGAGNLVNGAQVTLLGYSIFGSAPPVSGTAVNGTFTAANMFFGTFLAQAKDPATNLAASASGSITAAEPAVTKVLTLASYGAVQGTVYRADGTTTVSGATVTIFGSTTVTDSQGKYALSFLPLGTSSISVRDQASRGLGFGQVTLNQQGQTKTVDVTLIAQGTLVVTVQTASGDAVPNAQVRVGAGTGPASDTLFATTDANGTAVVNRVIIGSFNVRADSGNLSGFATGSLAANEQKAVVVHLQPTARIEGVVKAPNDAPVTAGTVNATNGSVSVTVPIGSDGTFHADNLVFGSYTLTAYDAQNRVRAHVLTPIVLSSPNQVAQTSMKFVGLGTVSGRVLNPDGSSAGGLAVQVRSLNAEFGGFRPVTTTNAGGVYSAEDIPVGDFTVSVANPVLHLRGEATGTIQQDGSSPTLDILLQNNLIDLPVTKWDANNFKFDLQKDGSVLDGTNSVFTGNYAGKTWGALQLDVIAGGTTTRFTGANVATVEEKNREIAIHQDNVGGLSVTRKVFVPADGYFARYLEIVTNPTDAPVTAGLRLTSNISGNSNGGAASPEVFATSSGDTQLGVTDPATRDRWVVIDDVQPADPFIAGGAPATAFVFDGPGATAAVSSAAFAQPDPAIQLGPRELSYAWQNITIPPGGTVALMHFVVQETTRPAAQAAAERLLQLSPEALAGLSTDEIAEVKNFAMPVDGNSTLSPLPSLTGSVSGHVFASDGTTTVSTVTVKLQSDQILFGRIYQVTSAATGTFSFTSSLAEGGNSRVIPISPFTLRADHPTLPSVVSPIVLPGQFAESSQAAQADVVFANTGIARGIVRLNGVPAAGATVGAHIQFSNGGGNYGTLTAGDGSYAFVLLPPSTVTVTATTTQQGVAVQGSAVATVIAGQTSVADISIDTITPQGSISNPAAGTLVDPRNPLAVTINASDAGGVAQITLSTTGVVSTTETRTISPAVSSRTETFTVPFDVLPPTGGTLTLTGTIRDAAANQTTSTPVTVNVRDVVAPDITQVAPASGATAVEPDAAIVLRFSEPIDRASVTSASLRLTKAGVAVPTSTAFSEGDRTATLTPTSPLALNTTFTIDVTTQIRDVAGNSLSSSRSSAFKTKSPDTASPKVMAIAPADKAVNVPVGTDIRVTFTEAIERSSVTAASFRVSTGGAPIPGQFTFLDSDATVRFAPDAALPFDVSVVVELTSGITDRFNNALVDSAGQPLSTPLTFTFSTGSFGITSPTQGSDVLENSVISLEAKASAALNIATMTFSVNGQALPAIAGPPFVRPINVGLASATPTLTIVATGKNAAGAQVAQDQVVVKVVPALRAVPRLVGVPRGSTSVLRLVLPSALSTDLTINLSTVDSTIASVPSSVVIPAGQTSASVIVTAVATGATTIVATSARGDTWAIASVSPLVSKPLQTEAAATGVLVVPVRSAGKAFAPLAGQSNVDVPILTIPATVMTSVEVTSSNAAVASGVATVIQPGSQAAHLTITTGIAGTAVLTIRAGDEIRQLTVVVGNPAAGTVAPIMARPVGIAVLPVPSAGRVLTAPAAQSAFMLRLTTTPVATATTVIVSSSNPNVATVTDPVVIAAGTQVASVHVITGIQGTATLTLRAGSEIQELTIVVGTPAAGTVAPVMASSVGVAVLQERRLGNVLSAIGGQSNLNLPLLSTDAVAPTTVTVTSSNPNIAMVNGPVVVAPGSRSAALTILTGIQGVATLTLRAGNDVAQLVVVVGTPPASLLPVITAPIVGVEKK